MRYLALLSGLLLPLAALATEETIWMYDKEGQPREVALSEAQDLWDLGTLGFAPGQMVPTYCLQSDGSWRGPTETKIEGLVALTKLGRNCRVGPPKPLTRQQIEHLDNLVRASEMVKDLSLQWDAMARERRVDCLKALGGGPFCECLLERTGVGLTLELYVVATTNTDEELGYSALTKDEKKLVDQARAAREACVSLID